MKNRRIWAYSGNRPSNGAKVLSEQEGFLRLRPDRFHKVRPADIIVNWGTTTPFSAGIVLNKPEKVALASNKLDFFSYLFGPESPEPFVKTVEWSNLKEVAQGWLDKKSTVVCRHKLTGHSGDGIVIVEPGQELPDAPLYTKYIFKVKEFRVHVCGLSVIDTQQKIRDPGREPTTWKVRSHDNGFIFVRNNIAQSDQRNSLAINAINAVGLVFGAVDIVEDKNGDFYVLEVNTAPGLEGQTIQKYAEAFRGYQG